MTVIILLSILIVLTLAATVLSFLRKGDGGEAVKEKLIAIEANVRQLDMAFREESGRNREENQKASKAGREELNNAFKLLGDGLTKNIADLSNAQKNQFEVFAKQLNNAAGENRRELKEIRETVESKLAAIQNDNNKKLEEMRRTVDEKLQETVEKRFKESFRLISDRLEEVHKGLGEMQTLASGVGDLKKVLTNVKTRGNLGEIQLGAILGQILSPEQYEQNAVVKAGSQERVEYAIKLPDKNNDNRSLLLPVDSKFPNEDYQRLLEAYEHMAGINPKEMEAISKQFENSVRKNAKDIKEKYINPPVTTDFAIMFVPTEGLYAEILRRTGLFELLQREFKITVVGPTNLVAFLSSLQMGFKTLAIEKRSGEVWEVLGAVKTEFGHFGTVLEKTRKKLQEATNVIEQAGVRSRAIERKLRTVQQLPQDQTLGLPDEAVETEPDETEPDE
jgi:DNA recombination protein RmuC